MKKQITIRVDADVLDWFKSQGRGYQTMMNEALRIYMNGMNTPSVDVTEFYKDGPKEFGVNFFKPMPKK